MPIHFSLDFTAPFQVGDVAYTVYPPNQEAAVNGVTNVPCLKVTISTVKLIFGTGPSGSLVVTELTDTWKIKIESVIYTVVPDANLFSAFTIEWSPKDDKLQLFHTEDELLTYQDVNTNTDSFKL